MLTGKLVILLTFCSRLRMAREGAIVRWWRSMKQKAMRARVAKIHGARRGGAMQRREQKHTQVGVRERSSTRREVGVCICTHKLEEGNMAARIRERRRRWDDTRDTVGRATAGRARPLPRTPAGRRLGTTRVSTRRRCRDGKLSTKRAQPRNNSDGDRCRGSTTSQIMRTHHVENRQSR